MEFAYLLGGGAPVMKKFIVEGGGTVNAGIPVISNMEAANAEGVAQCTTTAAVGCLGLAVDTASSTASQLASGADNAGYVSVIVNPDACYRAKLSGGAAADTAIAVVSAAQTASTDGLTVTSATDEFTVWGYTGTNAGVVRRCSSAATVILAFPRDIASLDTFLQTSTVFAEATQWPTLCTELTQIDATAAVAGSNDNFTVVEHLLRDASRDGNVNSYAILTSADHAFRQVGVLAS